MIRNIFDYIAVFNKYRFLLINLVAKDFKLKYRRSMLGVLWSVLNPLLSMLVITAVFQHIFRMEIEDFPVYYMTGITIFNLMVEATTNCLNAITGNISLIKKVYVPKYIFILEKCLFSLVNFIFALVAVFIVMFVLGFRPSHTMYLFWVPVFYTFTFSIGLGLILAAMNVFFRDTGHLYGVITMSWMFLTPIIYPKELLSENMQVFLQYNPMYHFVEYFRDVLMYGNIPGLGVNMLCLAISFGVLAIGLVVFKMTQDKFILYV